ncbi:MAG: ParA family protein [Ruminococcus flavefaciens]|nr:ParA family protein [Ruminococcus flavefaciens]
MKIIVIANQKGGIGKTTTATALASILSEQGYHTLLIDADQQGNSSDTYKAKIEGAATLYDVLLDEEPIPLQEAVQSTESGDIVASDPLLRKADEILNANVAGLYRLQDALGELKGYDYVVIDTAPAMNSILHNCLVAADSVVIPVTADRYALQGLAQLNQTINAVKKHQNKKLNIAGFLLVKYNPRTLLSRETKESLEKIAADMDTKLFETAIRESTKAKEAQAVRTALIKYAPNSTTAQDYIRFVRELLDREGVEGIGKA